MPKHSKESSQPMDMGPAGVEWRSDLDGYVTEFVKIGQDADLTALLQGLPNDQCPSPHWGYVLKGRLWFNYGDHVESINAGEAFYTNPGHTSGADAGSEFLIFSPAETLAEVEAHMQRRAQELQYTWGESATAN